MRVRSSVAVWGALAFTAACGTTTFAVGPNDAGSAAPGEDATHAGKDASRTPEAGHDAIAEATSPGADGGHADAGVDAHRDAVDAPVDAANDGCAFFCDDFDEYSGTMLPTPKWIAGTDASVQMVLSTALALSGPTSALAAIPALGSASGQTVSAIHTADLLGKATAGVAFDTDVYIDPGMVAGVTARPTGIVLAVAVGNTAFAIQAMSAGSSETYEVVEAIGKASLALLGPLSVAVPNAKWIHVRFLATPGALAISVQPAGQGLTTAMYAAGNPAQFIPADLTSPTASISIGLTSVTVAGSLKVYYDNVVIGLP
jgi:hypothetical protein